MAWHKVQIKEFLVPREERYKPDDPPISSMPRIEKIDFTGKVIISDKPSRTNMIVVRPGDFVISGINVAKGAMAVYQGTKPVKATIHYSSYTVNHEVINLEYFKRFLKSTVFVQLLKEQVPGGIKTEIKPKHLMPFVIDLPELPEQEAILSKFLNTEEEYVGLADEIANQRKLLKKYRQAILQEAIEGKLTADWRAANPDVEPASELLKRIAAEKAELVTAKKIRKQKPLPPITDDEIPFEIPEMWEWCRLGNILHFTDSGWSPACPPIPASPSQWGVLKTTSVQELAYWAHENKVLPNNLKPRSQYEVQAGELLITRAGPSNRVGICCCVEKTRARLMISDKIIRMHPASNIWSPFIAICFAAPDIKKGLADKKKDMAQSQVNISQENLKTVILPVPPSREQQAIVERVQAKLALCDKLEAEIAAAEQHTEQLSTAILQEVFDR